LKKTQGSSYSGAERIAGSYRPLEPDLGNASEGRDKNKFLASSW